MQILLYLTDFIVPLVIFGIVGYGLLMKVPVYDTFIKGAKKGFLTVIKIGADTCRINGGGGDIESVRLPLN